MILKNGKKERVVKSEFFILHSSLYGFRIYHDGVEKKLANQRIYICRCGGPKLVSFSGDSKKLTPKARLYVLLGYHAPFDRHDWTIDRCGKKIDYVIDFYSGKRDPKNPGIPSFYLDVRPKVSVEGAWMRAQRWVSSFI